MIKEIEMTTTNAGTNAGAALAAAIENETLHKSAAQVKARAANLAQAKSADLVARAATGAEVDAACLLQAQNEARVAAAEFDIASAIQRGAEKRRQEAEIAVWFEQAENLKSAVEQRLNERFAAATAVDSCLAELNRAIARFNEAGRSFSNARIAASGFTADRESRVAGNPVLAAMPAGTHPNASNKHAAEVRQIKAAIFDAAGGLERPIPIASLVQRETFLWGRASGS